MVETGSPCLWSRSALLGAVVLLAQSSAFAEVTYEPALSLGIARTDNLTLSPADRIYETVFQLVPEVLITQESSRVTSNLAVRLEAFRYDTLDDSEVYDLFDGETRIGLDPESLWLELGATRSQAIRNPEEPITINRLPITPNRIGQDNLYIGPAFEYGVGQNATFGGSVRRRWIKYDDELNLSATIPGERLDEFTEDTAEIAIDNYRLERGMTWAVRFDSDRVRSREEEGPKVPWVYREMTVELGAWAGDSMRLFVAGGKETPYDDPFNDSLTETFGEAGFVKLFGTRGTLEVAAGERSFGPSSRLNFDLQFSRGSTSLSYTESPTTDLRNANDRGRLLLLGQPIDGLTLPGSSERYIMERAEWNFDLDLRRAALFFTAYDELRNERAMIDGTPIEDERQRGITLTGSWRVGARTELSLTGDRVHRETTAATIESLIRIITLRANYDVGPRTGLELAYEYATEDFDLAEPGVAYDVRLVSLLITRGFQ